MENPPKFSPWRDRIPLGKRDRFAARNHWIGNGLFHRTQSDSASFPAFPVETIPDPNNLAYTLQALPLHTDVPNQEMPPRYQFLHCGRNDAEGGESVFADAYMVAEKVRRGTPMHSGYRLRSPFHTASTIANTIYWCIHRSSVSTSEIEFSIFVTATIS